MAIYSPIVSSAAPGTEVTTDAQAGTERRGWIHIWVRSLHIRVCDFPETMVKRVTIADSSFLAMP